MDWPIKKALVKRIFAAAKEGNLEMLRKNVSILPSVRDEKNGSASVLHTSACGGHLPCVDFISLAYPHMMRIQDNYGWIPLHVACGHGHLSVVSLLIERDPDTMGMSSPFGDTPLYFACYHGHLPIVSLLLDKAPLDLGILTTNTAFKKGAHTLLWGAVRSLHLDVTRVLLSLNPSPELRQTILNFDHVRPLGSQGQHAHSADEVRYAAFNQAISQLPIEEWRRQIWLQDEYLCVERACSTLEFDEDEEGKDESLCVLVVREVVLRHTRFIFQMNQRNGRAIPQESLRWNERKWYEKNPL